MSERYWKRLAELLEEIRSVVDSKLQPITGEQAAVDKGVIALIAFKFQGQKCDFVDSVVRERAADVEWTTEWLSNLSGGFMNYGIDSSLLAADVRSCLEAKISSGTCIRVYQSDIALLPVSLAERILKAKKSLKSLQSRVDVCFRIASAIDKIEKKTTEAQLEKLKLQFEKHEETARKAVEKTKAAELKAAQAKKVREERERRRQEKELQRSAKQSSVEKKKRSLEARANFMRRFVSKRVTPQKPSSPPTKRVIDLDSPKKSNPQPSDSEIEFVETSFNVDLYKEKSVMSASYWLRTLIDFDLSTKELTFLKTSNAEVKLQSVQNHLADCSRRRKVAEKNILSVLRAYRRDRNLHRDDKTPRFSTVRSDLRGRGRSGAMKLLKFDENNRPPFFGTNSTRSSSVSGRRPFGKDEKLDYEVDSDDEWEEGESLADVEEEKERATEDAELRMLYGSDDESDDDDFLDDEEVDELDDDDDDDCEDELVPESGVEVTMDNVDEVKPPVIDVDAVQVRKKRSVTEICAEPSNAKKKRRRKSRTLSQARVEITGIDYGDSGTLSLLKRYPITRHGTSLTFKLFNPSYEEEDEVKTAPLQTATKAVVAPKVKKPQYVLDNEGILHLAMLIHGAPTSKEKSVRAFLNWRQDRKEVVPTQREVQNLIAQIAVREKREKDSKANWYVKDANLEAQVIEKNKQDLSLRNQILQLKHTARTMIIAPPPHPSLPASSSTANRSCTQGTEPTFPIVYPLIPSSTGASDSIS